MVDAQHKARSVAEYWRAEPPAAEIKDPNIDELKDDRLAQKVAMETIEDRPVTFARSCLYRAGWFWALYPNRKSTAEADAQSGDKSNEKNHDAPEAAAESLAQKPAATTTAGQESHAFDFKKLDRESQIIAVWYGLWFAMAVLGMFWLGSAMTSRVWLIPVLLVLTLTAIHAVYWSNMRMRAPPCP